MMTGAGFGRVGQAPRWAMVLAAATAVGGCQSGLPSRGTDDSVVTIGQPAVFRRERHIAGRFEDIQWLDDQLDDQSYYDQGIQGTSRSRVYEEIAAALRVQGPGVSAPNDDDNDDDNEDDDDVSVPGIPEIDEKITEAAVKKFFEEEAADQALTPTPTERLDDRLAFRDSVRAAMRQRSLDDVHDLRGYTLYELQFDLSLAAGRDSGRPVLVAMSIRDDKKVADHLKDAQARSAIAQAMIREAVTDGQIWQTRVRSDAVTTAAAEWLGEAVMRGYLAERLETFESLIDELQRTDVRLQEACDVDVEEIHAGLMLGDEADQALAADLRERANLCKLPLSPELVSQWDAMQASSGAPDHVALAAWCLHFDSEITPIADGVFAGEDSLFEHLMDAATELDARQAEIEEFAAMVRSAIDRASAIQQDQLARAQRAAQQGERDAAQQAQRTAEDAIRQSHSVARDLEQTVEAFAVIAAPIISISTSMTTTGDPSADPKGSLTTAISVANSLHGSAKQRELAKRSEIARRALAVVPERVLELASQYAVVHIAHAYVEASGGLIEFVEPGGGVSMAMQAATTPIARLQPTEDAASWSARVNDLLATPDPHADHAAWQPHVVSVSPSEQAEQLSVTARSLIARALSLAGSSEIGTVGAAGALRSVRQELRDFQAIERNPLLIGFAHGAGVHVHGVSEPHDVGGSFGWLIGPPLEPRQPEIGGAELWYRQRSTHHSVTATLLAPAWLDHVDVDVHVFEVADDGQWHPAGLNVLRPPHPRHGASMRIDLPIDPASIARWVKYGTDRAAAAPAVALPRNGFEARAGQDANLVIQGRNLWRNPQVYVAGQAADEVHILPDLNGLQARFLPLDAPPDLEREAERYDLVVSTTTGSDVIQNAVNVRPPKERKSGAAPSATLKTTTVLMKDTNQAFDVGFELDPPLQAWSKIRYRLRLRGGADGVLEGEFPDKDNPNRLSVGPDGRSLNLIGLSLPTSSHAASKVVEYEIDVWRQPTPRDDDRRITSGQIITLYGHETLNVAAVGGADTLEAAGTNASDWKTVAATDIKLEFPHVRIDQLKALSDSFDSASLAATVQLGAHVVEGATLKLEAGTTRDRLVIRLPKGVPVKAAQSGETPADQATLEIRIGAFDLSAKVKIVKQ